MVSNLKNIKYFTVISTTSCDVRADRTNKLSACVWTCLSARSYISKEKDKEK